jgi:hypothetical protein
MMAAAIKGVEISDTPHPDCCERKGFLWDLTAAYPAARAARATKRATA